MQFWISFRKNFYKAKKIYDFLKKLQNVSLDKKNAVLTTMPTNLGSNLENYLLKVRKKFIFFPKIIFRQNAPLDT